jgi:hypothetical protein
LFITPTLIAILFALVQAWRAAAADHSALEVMKARGHEGGSTATLVLRYIRKVRHAPLSRLPGEGDDLGYTLSIRY